MTDRRSFLRACIAGSGMIFVPKFIRIYHQEFTGLRYNGIGKLRLISTVHEFPNKVKETYNALEHIRLPLTDLYLDAGNSLELTIEGGYHSLPAKQQQIYREIRNASHAP